jgi:hypothetical protein
MGCVAAIVVGFGGFAIFMGTIMNAMRTSQESKTKEDDARQRLVGVWLSGEAEEQVRQELGLSPSYIDRRDLTREEVAGAVNKEGCLQIRGDGQVLVGNNTIGTIRNSHGMNSVNGEIIPWLFTKGERLDTLQVFFPNRSSVTYRKDAGRGP